MTGLFINPGSGSIPHAGYGWTNTFEKATERARDWLQRMHADGLTEVQIVPSRRESSGRWHFTFRHTVTGAEVELETHGIDDLAAYEAEKIFAPRVYWNGSSSAEPQLSDFAAPGFKPLLTFVRDEP